MGEAEINGALKARTNGCLEISSAEHFRALVAYVALSALSIHMRTEPGPLARAITFGAFGALKQKTENQLSLQILRLNGAKTLLSAAAKHVRKRSLFN